MSANKENAVAKLFNEQFVKVDSRKRISQETFDSVVKENVDDFDMSPEEAVADAIQQFKSQGVDLSCIVKSAGPASESPVIKAVEGLLAACDASPADPEARKDALTALCEVMTDNDSRVLAGENDAVLLILRCCGGGGGVASVQPPPTNAEVEIALGALHAAIRDTVDNSDRLRDFDAAGIKMLLLRCSPDAESAAAAAATAARTYEKLRSSFSCEAAPATVSPASSPADDLVPRAAMRSLQAALVKNEQNRQLAARCGLAPVVSMLLDRFQGQHQDLAAVCTLARVFTFDDDSREDFANASEHAALLAEAGVLQKLVVLLHGDVASAEASATVAKLLVRNEYCKKLLELNVLDALHRVATAHAENPRVCGSVCQAVKSLAGNDEAKKQVQAHAVFGSVVHTLLRYSAADSSVAEAACGAIGALCLRHPENSHRFAQTPGAFAALKECLLAHLEKERVVRAACVAIRNLVARCRDLVDPLLELGIERPLRMILEQQPGCCDYAKAAMRDLGCDVAFREDWKGTGHKLLQGDP